MTGVLSSSATYGWEGMLTCRLLASLGGWHCTAATPPQSGWRYEVCANEGCGMAFMERVISEKAARGAAVALFSAAGNKHLSRDCKHKGKQTVDHTGSRCRGQFVTDGNVQIICQWRKS